MRKITKIAAHILLVVALIWLAAAQNIGGMFKAASAMTVLLVALMLFLMFIRRR